MLVWIWHTHILAWISIPVLPIQRCWLITTLSLNVVSRIQSTWFKDRQRHPREATTTTTTTHFAISLCTGHFYPLFSCGVRWAFHCMLRTLCCVFIIHILFTAFLFPVNNTVSCVRINLLTALSLCEWIVVKVVGVNIPAVWLLLGYCSPTLLFHKYYCENTAGTSCLWRCIIDYIIFLTNKAFTKQ